MRAGLDLALRLVRPALRGAVHAAARRSLVPPRGVHRISGLDGDVVVTFDEHLVPHVEAASDADVLLAQGFCHGLHRFFQMDMTRRVLRGTLAEVVGERPLGALAMPPFSPRGTTTDADRFLRALDLLPAARRYVAQGDEEGVRLLEAYARGVNAALERLRRGRPLEHRLLRLPLRPWRPVDSVLVAKGMALGLSFKWRCSPVFASIAERLAGKPEHLAEILPPLPQAGDVAHACRIHAGIGQALAFVPMPGPATGSNAFLVGAGRSRSGHPLLASDPHLELSLPSVWYLASLKGPRYRAVGCSIPGLPGIVIGRTSRLAWGLTNGMIDDADLWVEELDAAGSRYRLDGRWRPLAVETQEIRRRGRPPVMMRLRRTHRGPLLSDGFPAYDGPPLSLRMTLHEPSRDLETFLAVARAEDGDGLDAALDGYGAPCQNLLWADVRGEAGWRLVGRVPRRDVEATHPALPRDGRTARSDWWGVVPADELPGGRLAPGDVLVSANHPQVAGDYPHYLSHLYEPAYRAERIHELLAGRDDLGIDDLARIQLDAENLAARWFRRHVLEPHAEAVRRTRPDLAPLLDRLLAWDGRERAGDRGPAVWHLTYHHLLRRTFGPAIGEDLVPSWLSLVNLMDAPLRRAFEREDGPWAPPRVRASLLGSALEDARADLARRGLDAESAWGEVHRLRLGHPLGASRLLGPLFDRGPFPYDGGPFAVMSGQYLHARPAGVRVAASYRHVVDLADPEGRSRMITFGGQSGNVASPHYDDLTPLWLAGESLPMRLECVPARADVMRLEP